MNKKPLIVVSLCAVVLLVLGSLSNVVGFETEGKENITSISEGSPDITIVGVEYHYYFDDGYVLNFIIKNIGDAPTQEVVYTSDSYVFGLIPHSHCEGTFGSPSFEPGDTEELPITSFYPLLEFPPFIGVLRVKCSAEASNEKDYSNNDFSHSYFIVKLGFIWVFKELPW